jgi:hypothetical protein
MWTRLICLRIYINDGLYELDNKTSVSIKFGEFVYYMSDY